ncbi:MAG: alpha/beta fold hydrolase, partial [Actinomycetota bacterium]
MRRPSPIRSLIVVTVVVAVIASCGTTNTTTPTSADTTIANSPTTTPVDTLPTTTLASSSSIPQPPVQPITWSACKGSAKVKCTTLEVPYDYENPSLGSFTLSVRMRTAGKSPSVGPLFVNRGGPGAESASMATDAEFYFSKRLIDNFDIVTFDPRGTGASEPHVDCVEEVDSYFAADITYDTPEERQRLINDAQAFNAACEAKSGEILPYISTIASARDIDTLRRALGYDKISYFGFSYGSELGAT